MKGLFVTFSITALCYYAECRVVFCVMLNDIKANGREPTSSLGQVFNFKLGYFTKHVQLYGLYKRGWV